MEHHEEENLRRALKRAQERLRYYQHLCKSIEKELEGVNDVEESYRADFMSEMMTKTIPRCEGCGQRIQNGESYRDLFGDYVHDDFECIMNYVKKQSVASEYWD